MSDFASSDRAVAAADSPDVVALTGLALASTNLRPDDISAVVAQHVAKLGFDDLQIYLADLEQRVLVPLPADGFSSPDPLSVDGTLAGRSYRSERPVMSQGERGDGGPEGAGTTVWLPLLDSAERLGVLSFRTQDEVADELLKEPAETMRLVGHAVLDHQNGVLQDDATLLLLAWQGPE